MRANPEGVPKFVMPLNPYYLTLPEIKAGLQEARVKTVKFWAQNYGWTEYDIEGVDAGRVIEILNPFPLTRHNNLALAFFSQLMVGTTGDQSLYEAISMGKLPYHELATHQFFVRHQLESIADHPALETYFRTLKPEATGESLTYLQAHPENH